MTDQELELVAVVVAAGGEVTVTEQHRRTARANGVEIRFLGTGQTTYTSQNKEEKALQQVRLAIQPLGQAGRTAILRIIRQENTIPKEYL